MTKEANGKPRGVLALAGIALGLVIAGVVVLVWWLGNRNNRDDTGAAVGGSTPDPTCDPLPAPPTCKAFQKGLSVGCEPPVDLEMIRPLTEDMIIQTKALFNDRVAYSSESDYQAAAEPGDLGRVAFDFIISTEYDTAAWKASEIAQFALQAITANDPDLKDTVITVSSLTDAGLASNPKEKTIVTFYKVSKPSQGEAGRTVTMPSNNRNLGSAYVRDLNPGDKCYTCD